MAFYVDFTLESLLTQLITPKSELAVADQESLLMRNPSRVLLASIRDKGYRPCPRCLVSKQEIKNLGLPKDRRQRVQSPRVDNLQRRNKISSARRIIYEENYRVNSAAVERILKEESLVPTSVGVFSLLHIINLTTIKNAFSERLHTLSFNFFDILVVDLLHEFELGVWKALFIHLLRILSVINPSLLNVLDQRKVFCTFWYCPIHLFSP